MQILSAWWRNPIQTGALWPSGSNLAEAMAAQVDPVRGHVVELGSGTGAVTRALLARGLTPEQLVVVEKDPALFGEIKRRFPGIVALNGDAGRLRRLLSSADARHPGTLVSSLPLLGMARRKRLRVLIEMFASLGAGGVLVQFTYSPLPPIGDGLADALGVSGARVAQVFSNLPPAAVWVYRAGRPRRELRMLNTRRNPIARSDEAACPATDRVDRDRVVARAT
jgi:phosphatidylethanolamine/phosphatidyl-N-methylethanolamine N-methyltransferase